MVLWELALAKSGAAAKVAKFRLRRSGAGNRPDIWPDLVASWVAMGKSVLLSSSALRLQQHTREVRIYYRLLPFNLASAFKDHPAYVTAVGMMCNFGNAAGGKRGGALIRVTRGLGKVGCDEFDRRSTARAATRHMLEFRDSYGYGHLCRGLVAMSDGAPVACVRSIHTARRLFESVSNYPMVATCASIGIVVCVFNPSASRLAYATRALRASDALESDDPGKYMWRYWNLIQRTRLPKVLARKYTKQMTLTKDKFCDVISGGDASSPELVFSIFEFQASACVCYVDRHGGTLEDISEMLRMAACVRDEDFKIVTFAQSFGQNVFIILTALVRVSSPDEVETEREAAAEANDGAPAGSSVVKSGGGASPVLSRAEARVALRLLLSRFVNLCSDIAQLQDSNVLKCRLHALLIEEALDPEGLASGRKGPAALRALVDELARTPPAWTSAGEEGFLRVTAAQVNYHVVGLYKLTQSLESAWFQPLEPEM
jgi:hypothetical protein